MENCFPPYTKSGVHLFGRDRDNQSLAAFGTTPLEDNLSILGLHTFAKPMGPLSFNFTGLIGAFAHGTDSLVTIFKQRELFAKAYF